MRERGTSEEEQRVGEGEARVRGSGEERGSAEVEEERDSTLEGGAAWRREAFREPRRKGDSPSSSSSSSAARAHERAGV